ncbi:MAG: hypothetical protein JNK29_02335, partial [Anaerolineales bacterium]|nr:hypothetical protein [Anaerolineales bacterium]
MIAITFGVVGAAALLVWLGARYRTTPAWPRFLTFSLAGLLGLTLLSLVFEPTASLAMGIVPAAAGLLAALMVYWDEAGRPWRLRPTWGLAGLLGLGVVGAALWRISQGPLALLMLALGLVAGLAWQASAHGPRRARAWLALGVVWLAGPLLWLLIPEASLGREPDIPTVIYYLTIYLAWPGLTTVLAGRLVFAALAEASSAGWGRRLVAVTLAAGLITAIGGLVSYQTTWDLATDGLSALGLISMAVLPAAVAAGMLMAWSLPGWRRLG